MTAVLSDIGIAGGCLFLACCACMVMLFALCIVADRRHPHAPAEPSPVPEAYERAACPWCDSHACLDSTLCNCEKPCGSWLCEVKEASRG